MYLYNLTLLTLSDPFIFHGTKAPSRPGSPRYQGFMVTLRHTTHNRTYLDARFGTTIRVRNL